MTIYVRQYSVSWGLAVGSYRRSPPVVGAPPNDGTFGPYVRRGARSRPAGRATRGSTAEAHPSSRAISSSDSSIAEAATFYSRCSTEDVPGIGSVTGERWSSQAIATW